MVACSRLAKRPEHFLVLGGRLRQTPRPFAARANLNGTLSNSQFDSTAIKPFISIVTFASFLRFPLSGRCVTPAAPRTTYRLHVVLFATLHTRLFCFCEFHAVLARESLLPNRTGGRRKQIGVLGAVLWAAGARHGRRSVPLYYYPISVLTVRDARRCRLVRMASTTVRCDRL